MENKFIALAVGLTVGVIMLSGFLWPVVADATATEKTFVNKGYYDVTYSEADNLTFEWDHTAPTQIAVNNTVVTLPDPDSTIKTVLCGDNWVVRYFENSGNVLMQFYGSSGSQISASVSDGTDLTVTCSNGDVEVANTASPAATYETTYTYLYVADNTGPFVMKDKDAPAYLNGDSPIFAMGLTRVGTVPNMGISITGNIDDGFTWSMFRGSDVTFSDEAAVYSEVAGYIDLYQLDKLTATATNDTGPTDVTYNYFIVPKEVTAELANHLDTTQIALVAAIGTLGAIVLIAAAAGSIRRLD